MNTLSKYVLLLLVSFLAACGSDDDAAATFTPGTPQPGDALAVTITASDFVTDGDPDTRATDKGPVTTFEDGDSVGIIILDKDKNPLYNNIPYKYVSSSQKWVAADTEKGACYYDPQAYTYIVYYPYSAKADDCKNEIDLKAIFKPQTDQSRKEDYRASDLMAKTTTSDAPLKSLKAELEHVYASISLAPITTGAKYVLEDNEAYTGNYKPNGADISKVNLTVGDDIYFLHQAADGTWRCILPAGTGASEPVRCFYTIGSKTYGNAIGIGGGTVANTRYTSSPEIGNVTYSLGNARVGDFYCKNDKDEGYLIPGDATLTGEQKTACIGIVYCTDIDRFGDAAKKVLKDKGVTTPHGLVMALTNASQCRWGDNGADENTDGTAGPPFKDNTSTLQKQYNNVDGYGETHWILKTYSGDALRDTYSAFYHASRYGTAEAQAQYAVPNATTGWFIPSMGQWWDILSNLGGIDLRGYRTDQRDYISISGAAQTAVDNMNKYLEKIEGAKKINLNTYFWSSSEYKRSYACTVYFYSSVSLNLNYSNKSSSDRRVRCVFAF